MILCLQYLVCFCACVYFKLLFICVWSCRCRFRCIMFVRMKAYYCFSCFDNSCSCLIVGAYHLAPDLRWGVSCFLITWAHLLLICDDGTRMQTNDWTHLLLSEMIVHMSVHEAMGDAFNFHVIIIFKRFEMTCYINIQLFLFSVLFGFHKNDTLYLQLLLRFQGLFSLLLLHYWLCIILKNCYCSQTCLNSKWNDFIKLLTEMCINYLCAVSFYFTQRHQIQVKGTIG